MGLEHNGSCMLMKNRYRILSSTCSVHHPTKMMMTVMENEKKGNRNNNNRGGVAVKGTPMEDVFKRSPIRVQRRLPSNKKRLPATRDLSKKEKTNQVAGLTSVMCEIELH